MSFANSLWLPTNNRFITLRCAANTQCAQLIDGANIKSIIFPLINTTSSPNKGAELNILGEIIQARDSGKPFLFLYDIHIQDKEFQSASFETRLYLLYSIVIANLDHNHPLCPFRIISLSPHIPLQNYCGYKGLQFVKTLIENSACEFSSLRLVNCDDSI